MQQQKKKKRKEKRKKTSWNRLVSLVNITNSLSNLGVYIRKIKVKTPTPTLDGPLRKILKHEIEVENNLC